MANHSDEYYRQRLDAWTSIAMRAVPWLGFAVLLGVGIPLADHLEPIAQDLAGKNTTVTWSVSVSVVANILLGGTYFVQRSKIRKQQGELERLRGKQEALDQARLAEVGVKKAAAKRPAKKGAAGQRGQG